MGAADVTTLVLASVGATLGVFNTWYLFRAQRPKLKVTPKLCFDISGGRYLARDWDAQVQQLRAAGADARWGIEVINLSPFAVTIEEVGFTDGTDDGRICIVDPEISEGRTQPVRLIPRDKVIFYNSEGMKLPPSVLANPLAYAKTACDQYVYGSSPVLRKEARMMQIGIPVPLAEPQDVEEPHPSNRPDLDSRNWWERN